MYFRYPIIIFILLAAVIALSSCTPRDSRFIVYPQKRLNALSTTKTNAELERVRQKNMSVIRTEMALKGMNLDSPMLIRAFKEEMELELWVKSSYSDEYILFRIYEVCKASGGLGPKLQEGDKQTPEGFYATTRDRLNPNSSFFLSFNIGFPNQFDQYHGRTGSLLMIHGGCASEGCLAMTDPHIAEIYLIVEQNFEYGHAEIPIHMFPFRMTDHNMSRHRLSQWYPFWQNLKQGYDYFERYYQPPTVEVVNGRYVFE